MKQGDRVFLLCFILTAIVLSLIVLLAGGCATRPQPVKVVMPPSPWGPGGPPQGMLAVSRAAAVIGPPAPHVIAFDLPATFSDMEGDHLWHSSLYVQVSTNLVDWQTVRVVPLAETPCEVRLTNVSPVLAVRTGF